MESDSKLPTEPGVIIDNEIQWVETVMRLDVIRPFERNPRNITEIQFQKLKQSLMEDGYHSRMKVTHDHRLVGGHQRLRALRELGYHEVPVLVPSVPITDEQYIRIMMRDNHNNGTWDFEILANDYDLEWLRGIGLHDITNIPPIQEEGEGASQRVETHVRCPSCLHEFPAKGNKIDAG